MRLKTLCFLIYSFITLLNSTCAFRWPFAWSEHKVQRALAGKTKRAKPSSTGITQLADGPPDKRFVLPRIWSRIFYSISALNPFLAVVFNDYTRMVLLAPRSRPSYPLIFFTRLKPRVSFAIGAILRALQMTTAFQYVFDPTIGVGLGLDLVCYLAQSRWPATIVLGWSVTPRLWHALGAAPPSSRPVPISISMRHK